MHIYNRKNVPICTQRLAFASFYWRIWIVIVCFAFVKKKFLCARSIRNWLWAANTLHLKSITLYTAYSHSSYSRFKPKAEGKNLFSSGLLFVYAKESTMNFYPN